MAITGYREEKAWKGCMNRKTTLDITIILSGITGMVLSYAYLEDPMERQVSLIVLGTVSFFLSAGSGRQEQARIYTGSRIGTRWDIRTPPSW